MPQLPRLVSDQPAGVVRQPRGNPPQAPLGIATAEGEAAARLGEQVASIGLDIVHEMNQKRKQAQDMNDYSQRSRDAALLIDQAVREEEENPDFRTHNERIGKRVAEIQKKGLEGKMGDEVRLRLRGYLDEQSTKAIIGARNYADNKENEAGQGLMVRGDNEDLNEIANLTGAARDKALGELRGRWAGEQAAGFIDAPRNEQRQIQWFKKLDSAMLSRDIRLDPKKAMDNLIADDMKGEGEEKTYQYIDAEERQVAIKQAEQAYIAEGERRRRDETYAIEVENRVQQAMSESIYQRARAGQDVTAELAENALKLGEFYDNTIKNVQSINEMRGNTQVTFSNQVVFSDFKARLGGSNRPTRGEVFAATQLNGQDKQFLLNEIERRAQQDRESPLSPRQSAALQDGEEAIRRRLTIYIPGVSSYTEPKGEAQSIAINETLIVYDQLAREAIARGEFFDGRKIGSQLAATSRNGPWFEEGIIKYDEKTGSVLDVYGAKTRKDVKLELNQRVKSGELTEDTANFLWRRAATLPSGETPKTIAAPSSANKTAEGRSLEGLH